MGRLQGRGTIVTGAGSGIGRATSKLFAAEGASVLCFDKTDGVNETVDAIKKAGGKAIAMQADASSEADVSKAVDTAVKEFGKLDAIYANAGISGGGDPPFFELTADHWRKILDVNLIGVFLAIKHASRVMVPNKKGDKLVRKLFPCESCDGLGFVPIDVPDEDRKRVV